MEQETSPPHWVGEQGQRLVDRANEDPQAEPLVTQLCAGPPHTAEAWRQLILSCLQYGSAPLVEAVLVRTQAEAFSEFALGFESRVAIDDACFALIVHRVWLPRISKLESLRISNVALSGASIERIVALIGKSVALKTLALTQCELAADDAHALWVAVLNAKCPLNRLDLSYSTISGALVRAADLALYPKRLTQLQLASAGLTAQDAAALASALRSWKGLQSLNLEDNMIGDEAGSALLRTAVEHASLRTLNLEGCALGTGFAATLVKVGGTTHALSMLELGRNDFSGMPTGLGDMVQRNRRLHTLELFNARLTHQGVNDLLRGLAGSHCALQVLDLSDNGLAELDLRPLIKNTTLQKLWLHGNRLPSAAYATLADMLQVHPALTWLNLDMTSGDQLAMAHLADGISRSQSLRRLRLLGQAPLTDKQMFALVKAVKGNASLSVLHVPCQLVEDSAVQWLFESALKGHPAMTDVSGSNFTWGPNPVTPKPIRDALARNQRANDLDLMNALHEVIKKCVVLGIGVLPDELAREIAWMLLGKERPRSVHALRVALRVRQVSKALAAVPMPTPDPKR